MTPVARTRRSARVGGACVVPWRHDRHACGFGLPTAGANVRQSVGPDVGGRRDVTRSRDSLTTCARPADTSNLWASSPSPPPVSPGCSSPIIGSTPPPAPATPERRARRARPASASRGTMIMVHGGGWSGPGPTSQSALMTMPGETISGRGWKIVSVDYHAGSAGLQDVLDATDEELAKPAGGPLCLYGESAGAQLVLVAAARLSGVACVAAMGPPADFEAYQAEVRASNDAERSIIAAQMATVWGQTPEERAPNDPVKLARSIRGDVLVLREADDSLIPIEQVENFVAARPDDRARRAAERGRRPLEVLPARHALRRRARRVSRDARIVHRSRERGLRRRAGGAAHRLHGRDEVGRRRAASTACRPRCAASPARTRWRARPAPRARGRRAAACAARSTPRVRGRCCDRARAAAARSPRSPPAARGRRSASAARTG